MAATNPIGGLLFYSLRFDQAPLGDGQPAQCRVVIALEFVNSVILFIGIETLFLNHATVQGVTVQDISLKSDAR
jgi:hypothetical protein